ncbi:hypothetical protein RclHR1_09610013 [Rhizophagus clarus]|uniref:Uncharacterized protein n=1 Tax=Rhizophagus clarus TaxID=94130 RepID=A0A2Z6S588_9GLOM|nr:hypothetical protein RclHR1_09610013 [Rhizophagus clarus]
MLIRYHNGIVTILLVFRKRFVLPDEKHDRTFGIKVREVLPDERHDRTFGIKCCRTKSTTGLLELSVAGRKARPDFWN